MRKTIFIIIFIYTQIAIGQYTTRLEFAGNPEKNTIAGSFSYEGILYVSLNDISKALNLEQFVNKETQKIEIKASKYRIKLTANNTYVVITDEKEKGSLVQLHQKVFLAAGAFYVPLISFLPVLNKYLGYEAVYDEVNKTVIIGKAKTSNKFDISEITYKQKENGMMIQIHSGKKLTDYDSWIKYEANDKKKGWFYITIADVKADAENIKKLKPTGIIKEMLVFPSPASVQFTFKFTGQIISSDVIQGENGKDLIINLRIPGEDSLVKKKQTTDKSSEKDKWKLDVVVLDAGHGGKDPGAIGITKTHEKDITLAVTLKLGKIIENNLPDVKVIYTRKSDEFVELYKRGQIANQANGKLFLSIHCNSAPKKPHPANGFEVYLLRPGKTEHALRIAERENSVVKLEENYEQRYKELTHENFILLTMAQSAYMKYSEIIAEYSTRMVEKYTQLANQGVKQAGFYVLVGASMPNILVELGYLSNKEDEKYLKSEYGQQRIAEALFNAIKEYKLEYDRSLEDTNSIEQSLLK